MRAFYGRSGKDVLLRDRFKTYLTVQIGRVLASSGLYSCLSSPKGSLICLVAAKKPDYGFNCQTIFLSLDLDGHSDPEESFARDLPDFPSINPEVTSIDDEDDTSIGIPSLVYRSQGQEDLHISHNQDVPSELRPGVQLSAHNLTDELASLVTRGMIQLALSGASQPGPIHGIRQQQSARGFLRTSSSELDTDAEGDDFELLDQSELNQMDPSISRGQ